MKKIGLIVCMLLAVISLNAQTGNLVIFSDDGSKFFVVVNGLRVNDQAQTNVRVTGLNADYVNTKIVFENELTPDIEKKNLMLARGSEITYIVKKNKKNETVCNFYSQVELAQVPANNPNQQTVVYSNIPYNDGMVIRTGNGSTTTTTTTTTSTGTGINANVNTGGVGMNVTIYDANGGVVTGTTSTTTTTTYSSTTTNGGTTTTTTNGSGNNCIYGMSDTDFRSAKSSISSSSFDDTRANTFKQVVSSKCVNTNQVKEMLQIFSFEDTKLEMAKYAYTYVVDPSNYYSVNDIFTFSDNKDALSNYVMSHQR